MPAPHHPHKPATLLVHQAVDRDPHTGASAVPIYQASTFHHPSGECGQYEYSRGANPTRENVEQTIALLEGGIQGFATSSGMAAIGVALSLLHSGDHLIVPSDLYGGTYRYVTSVLPQQGIQCSFVNTADLEALKAALQPNTRGILLETPSNPLFTIADIRAVAELARERNILTFIDNTFMTPLLQRPIPLGIDVVIHSATKFLGGHSDLLAGLVTTADPELAKALKRFHNSFGAVLSPFDSFLLARGMKTLKIRLETAQSNAGDLALRLQQHPSVSKVYYPGLSDFTQADTHFRQADGPGAVLAFELASSDQVKALLRKLQLPIIAPSLGGVETIVTHCWSMSHAAIPAEVKKEMGISPTLIRLCAGIEDVDDLWQDLEQALHTPGS